MIKVRVKREVKKLLERIVDLADKRRKGEWLLKDTENDSTPRNIAEEKAKNFTYKDKSFSSTKKFHLCYSDNVEMERAVQSFLEDIYESYFITSIRMYDWDRGNKYLKEVVELLKTKTKKEVVNILLDSFSDERFTITLKNVNFK